jgi:hypothetical protein
MKKRKMAGTAAVFFVIGIMLSSATAVPVNQKEAIETTVEQQQLIKNASYNGLYEQALEEIYNHITNETALYFISRYKWQIEYLIDYQFGEYNEGFREKLYDVFETDSLTEQALLSRYNTLDADNFWETFSDSYGVVKNKEEFGERYLENAVKFIECWQETGFNDEEIDSLLEMIFSVMNCGVFAVTCLWIELSMAKYGGVKGFYYGLITALFVWAIVYSALALIFACIELLSDDLFLQGLMDTLIEYGIVAAALYLLSYLWEEKLFIKWLKFILDCWIPNKAREYNGCYEFECQESQVILQCNCGTLNEAGKPIEVEVEAEDRDFLIYDPEDGETVTMNRDAVRVGFDWDNDYVVDEWTDYYYRPDGEPYYEIGVTHTFSEPGYYQVNIRHMDSLGVSDWKSIVIPVVHDPESQTETPMMQNVQSKNYLTITQTGFTQI